MKKLAAKHPDKLLDLLTERLAFERSGVKLYDRIIDVMRDARDPSIDRMLPQMEEHRNEEKEHEEWLEAQIRDLGGSAHEETEMSRLVTKESKGIEEVILGGDAQISHLFHALLAAELVDNAGWDLLVEMADEAGDHSAKREFKKRLHEEEEHLVLMRKAVERVTGSQLFGEPVELPSGP